MTRRLATRRFRRVAGTTVAVFALAGLAAPERDVAPAPIASRASSPVTSIEVPPVWKPAGEVLRRKPAATAPMLRPVEDGQRATLYRVHQVFAFARRYQIPVELAGKIYDAAVETGIEPELAFRLVRVESVFKERATSPAGAIGLTQVMLGTARFIEPTITREQLYDPDTNLRIGFRYLRGLIREQKGNLRMALLVYNRGPVAVQSALASGLDPANGYERLLLSGYRGRGVLD